MDVLNGFRLGQLVLEEMFEYIGIARCCYPAKSSETVQSLVGRINWWCCRKRIDEHLQTLPRLSGPQGEEATTQRAMSHARAALVSAQRDVARMEESLVGLQVLARHQTEVCQNMLIACRKGWLCS